MRILLFTKPSCPNCPSITNETNQNANKVGIPIDYVIMDNYVSDAIGTYYDVLSVPTIILVDKHDVVITRWINVAPTIEELKKYNYQK